MNKFTVQDLPLLATSMASMMLDRTPDRSKLCTPKIVRPLGEHTASLSCERYKCLNSKLQTNYFSRMLASLQNHLSCPLSEITTAK